MNLFKIISKSSIKEKEKVNELKLRKNKQLIDKKYQIALSLIKGIGGTNFRRLINTFHSAENVFKTKFSYLSNISGIGQSIAKKILEEKTLMKAEKLIEYCLNSNIKILSYFDKEYPSRLHSIYNPPTILYYKGNISLNFPKIVSIVGTRKSTNYGKNFLTKLIQDLKNEGIIVVSGLASGIDYYTHKECLNNELENIGILPCSIEEIYPLKHTNLAREILKKGALLSEYGPFQNQEKYFFPVRNRIIAGISDVTIIIEAGKKSGALITAEFANNYNREVFALPGDIGRMKSEGCNRLIASHNANILISIDDIKYMMNWDSLKEAKSNKKINKINLDLIEKKAINSLNEFGSEGLNLEELSLNSGIGSTELSSLLIKLEMKNLIDKLPGGKIALKYA